MHTQFTQSCSFDKYSDLRLCFSTILGDLMYKVLVFSVPEDGATGPKHVGGFIEKYTIVYNVYVFAGLMIQQYNMDSNARNKQFQNTSLLIQCFVTCKFHLYYMLQFLFLFTRKLVIYTAVLFIK
jgi:hypothetical protein